MDHPCSSRFWVTVASVVFLMILPVWAAVPPVGVLTIATHAHLDQAPAFPGLSVFGGERLSTDPEGRLGVRIGQSTLTLGANTEVELVPISGGVHVDMDLGSLRFSAAANEAVEIHVRDAILRPATNYATQASITIVGPNVLQIAAEQGLLSFSYRVESRDLPPGHTYRVYLDDPDATVNGSVRAGGRAGAASKVTYFIVGAGAGVAAWGINDAIRSNSEPISPAAP